MVVLRGLATGLAVAIVTCLAGGSFPVLANEEDAAAEPAAYVYAVHGGVELHAYVFSPERADPNERRPAIVVLHGGGWSAGEAAWSFPRARHYAECGMVAVAVQYRLSDQETITPLEAIDDARAAYRWVRARADSLGVDPDRVAAHGWSAGAHLAVSVALFDDDAGDSLLRAAPDALVLVSPAVSLGGDGWFQRLLGERARALDLSPDEHVRAGMPPTLILQGSDDTVTPLSGAQHFCDRMTAAGNACALHVYEGYGHLFTPKGIPDDGMPQPDPAISKDATRRADEFLKSLGFVD